MQPDEVERVWNPLSSSADPLDPTEEARDVVDDAIVKVVDLLTQGVTAAAERHPGLLLRPTGIRSHGTVLPWLAPYLHPDAVSFYR